MKNRNYLKIHDHKIDADNYILQMSIGEYYGIIKNSIFSNTYQRNRVLNSKSIYALLKTDLLIGCVMPPIVLAYNDTINESNNIIEQLKTSKTRPIILDGLQRTLTISDLINSKDESINIDSLKEYPIRIEIYTNLSRIWLLYRMLTLNTGQTKMSTRHQIEIIYSSYKKKCDVEGVKLLSQVDDNVPCQLGEYRFRDIVDGFTSFIQMDYLTLDRMDILENVKDMERLSNMQSESDLFNLFLNSYNQFVNYIHQNSGSQLQESIEELHLSKAPFGKSGVEIFNKSQALTGFGAAIAKIRSLGIINDFESLNSKISSIDVATINLGLQQLLIDLDNVRKYAKKIGNDQRFYFFHFFRNLFSDNEGSYNIENAANKAFRQYEREVL